MVYIYTSWIWFLTWTTAHACLGVFSVRLAQFSLTADAVPARITLS
jgi:hypothetical protein